MHVKIINRVSTFGGIVFWSAYIDYAENQTQSDFLYMDKRKYLEVRIDKKRA